MLLQTLVLFPAFAGVPPSIAETFDTTESSATTPLSDAELATVTDRVFLNFGLCPEGVRVSDRRLGDKTILCTEPDPIGRIVIGLYGRAAPGTVANFKKLVRSGALDGSKISKIIPGQWIAAGAQGPHRSGFVEPPPDIQSNPDLLSPSAFRLRHLRPGTVSLNLSVNEDDEYYRNKRDYRALGFLITTGPGPASALDGENIVFGSVIEGFDTISMIGTVPTFSATGNMKAYNDFASFIGDERAATTRLKWGKPLKAVVITESGVLSENGI